MTKLNLAKYQVTTLQGQPVSLAEWTGKVLLVVNVASQCGFTPQYKGLQQLFERYKDRGFMVLGFPCNQFGAQEAGDADEIRQFCDLNYNVSFPMFAKIKVNGPEADPFYQDLREAAPGLLGTTLVKWNFTKFLIDRDGNVVERYAPQAEPESLVAKIEELLAVKADQSSGE